MAWLWWLLGAIVVVALLWWLFASGDDDDNDVAYDTEAAAAVQETTPAPMQRPGEPLAETIDDLSLLTGSNVPADMVGRSVALSGVPVAAAVSDRAFWLGSGRQPDQGVFAVRGNQSASFTAPDGDVDAGAMVNVWGTIAEMPDNLTQTATEWNLSSTDQAMLNAEGVYILADSVRIAGR